MVLDKIYVINLRTSPERLKNMKRLLNNLKIPENLIEYVIVDRPKEEDIPETYLPNYPHHNHRIGKYGCYTSHLKILKDIEKNNYKYALILEDDIQIVNDNIIELTNRYISQLDSFDILYLGGLYRGKSRSPERVSDNVYRSSLTNGTYAYVVSNSVVKHIPFIEKWNAEIDVAYRALSRRNRFYSVVPHIVEPIPYFKSDITGGIGIDYGAGVTQSHRILTGLKTLPEHKL